MFRAKLKQIWPVVFCVLLIAAQQAAAQAGHLDPTFGNGGIVTTDFGVQTSSSNVATPNAVVIQSDGKIVVAGAIPGSNGFPIAAVARYNTNGSLDASFGSSGIVSTASIEDTPFTSVAVQSDGKIVAVAGGFTAFVARYTSTGTLDSTFGTNGIVQLSEINGPSPSGVAIQSNGDILVANRNLFRLLSDGQLDTTFGSNGAARNAGYAATAVAILPNGEILTSSTEVASGFICRYQSNGALDTMFGINGQLPTPSTAPGVALSGTGDVISGGTQTNNSIISSNGTVATAFAIAGYLNAGIADGSFGVNGGTTTSIPNYLVVTTSGVAVQSSNDIVVVGTATQGANAPAAFALARYTPTGQLDTTFGTNGVALTVFPGTGIEIPTISANGLAIQTDSKIVVVGSYLISVPHQGFDTAFKVLRYLNQ